MAFPALGGCDFWRCSLTIGEARKGYVGGVLVCFAYGLRHMWDGLGYLAGYVGLRGSDVYGDHGMLL